MNWTYQEHGAVISIWFSISGYTDITCLFTWSLEVRMVQSLWPSLVHIPNNVQIMLTLFINVVFIYILNLTSPVLTCLPNTSPTFQLPPVQPKGIFCCHFKLKISENDHTVPQTSQIQWELIKCIFPSTKNCLLFCQYYTTFIYWQRKKWTLHLPA